VFGDLVLALGVDEARRLGVGDAVAVPTDRHL
jgi:hypothetical protein